MNVMARNESIPARWKRLFIRDWPLHLMLLLPVISLFIFCYIPMAGIVMSFVKYLPSQGIFHSEWVGLNNFQTLFKMPGFTESIYNTIIIAVVKIVLNIIVPVSFTLLLNEITHSASKRTIQTLIYLPHFISWVLMAGIVIKLCSSTGVLNQVLKAFGVEPKIWLADKTLFRPILYITDTLKEFGYGTIIYLAAISGINPSLYEAAVVDGAGKWKQMIHVTLPGISSTIILMSVLALGNVLNAGFDQIFNLYSPIVYETGDIIDTFLYRLAFERAQFDISTAAGLFKSAISTVLIILSYSIAYKTSGYRVF